MRQLRCLLILFPAVIAASAALPVDEWSPHSVIRFINALPSEPNERQLVEQTGKGYL